METKLMNSAEGKVCIKTIKILSMKFCPMGSF